MKKTNSIRLFLISATLGCCMAYGGGYYFSIHQSEKRMEQELASENQFLETGLAESMESAVVVSPYEFILSQEDGYVIVYYADGETMYSNTDIKVNSLPQRLQEEIEKGKQIYSEAELYNFLENYSS